MRVGSKDVNADGDGDNIAGHKTVDTTSEAEVVKQEGTTQKIVTFKSNSSVQCSLETFLGLNFKISLFLAPNDD